MKGAYNPLREGLKRYFSPKQLSLLRSTKVGIAGAGGLGSNAALILARCGVEKMALIDHDSVDASNLNRQAYWPAHIGMPKTAALAQILLELNPQMELDCRRLELDAPGLPEILACAPIWVEALDNAENKSLFVKEAVKHARFTVSASGVCGFGGEPLGKRKLRNLHIAGDFRTGTDQHPPLAPKVIQAAALMADSVLEFILAGTDQSD